MNLEKKQITFRNPSHVSSAISDGFNALAENQKEGRSVQAATNHCLLRVKGLTESKLVQSRSSKKPGYIRDGQSFITLIWVLLADGMLPLRKLQVVREWLIGLFESTDLFEGKLNEDDLPTLISIFTESTVFQEGIQAPSPEEISTTLKGIWAIRSPLDDPEQRSMPILNRLFIGREDDVQAIYKRIGIRDKSQRQALTIVRGWPGVGKTALVNVIIHSEEVRNTFADGVLWASWGAEGDVFNIFKSWARQLGALHLLKLQELPELIKGLRIVLMGRDIFILADDVWTEEQGSYIKQVTDLNANTLLITTRFTDLANYLKDLPGDIYFLDVLAEKYAVELLAVLAPVVAELYSHRLPQLVKALEALPLALRVAGPTLEYYQDMNLAVDKLLDEFENDYRRLLQSTAPSDRFDEITGKTPTIELLFQRSVETLSPEGQMAFISLGVFKHKPATFDADALQSVWEAHDPQVLIATLIGRGLMEVAQNKRYHVHQTLHMYANKLLDDYENNHP